MTRVEQLKAQLHAAIDAQSNEQALEEIQAQINSLNAQNPPFLSPEEEERVRLGLEDVAAGRVMSLEEFARRSDEAHARRVARHAQHGSA